MKVTKLKEEFRQSSVQDLREKLDGYRRELFSLKLNSSTAPVKDCSQFKKLRKNIAQILTYLHQAEQKVTTVKA